MSASVIERVVALAGARRASRVEHVQPLWDGYGEVLRVTLEGAPLASVVAKHVRPPPGAHPRKLRSYEVERTWYREHARRCPDACRVPRALAAEREGDGWLFVLEDLDAAGFSGRRHRLSDEEVVACLAWLASLHATFVHRADDASAVEGLWPLGTYWHLATRPDELAAMPSGALRDAAVAIDAALESCTYRTLVHGDAKTTNFCFAPSGTRVAAVDFQYVGGGCGVKDLVYFFGCLGERRCATSAERWLDLYFDRLRHALGPSIDAAALEAEWRALVPLAWADLERFLAGWSPGHHDAYAEAMTRRALAELARR